MLYLNICIDNKVMYRHIYFNIGDIIYLYDIFNIKMLKVTNFLIRHHNIINSGFATILIIFIAILIRKHKRANIILNTKFTGNTIL